MFKNKRKHERYPLFAIARVQIIGSREPAISCLMQSISKSGIGAYAYRTIEKGTSVSIEIIFKNYEGNKVSDTVRGKIVSLTDAEDSHCIGIEFNEELSPDKQPNLCSHLNEFARQK